MAKTSTHWLRSGSRKYPGWLAVDLPWQTDAGGTWKLNRSAGTLTRGDQRPTPSRELLAPMAAQVSSTAAQVAEEPILPTRFGRARLTVVEVNPKQRLRACEIRHV